MEEIIYKEHVIKIEYEECPDSPRCDRDNLGIMVCWHKNYNLGDKHYYTTPADFKKEITDTNAVILPLYLYDHSGITMNTTGYSCPWDSGQVGYIYVTKEKIRKEYGWRKITQKRCQKIIQYLCSEVQTYDDYLTGNVYGYTTLNANNEVIDSCSGYYGYNHKTSGLLESAKAEIDRLIERGYAPYYSP